ncbi:MAG: hypothetical protein NZ528_16585 [Caldilineales bacterium]|nr:hypothetical protein [Caldilineales bacterium]MDW8316852.1 hypothetical protein [Anaerolineae bacterium]
MISLAIEQVLALTFGAICIGACAVFMALVWISSKISGDRSETLAGVLLAFPLLMLGLYLIGKALLR